MRARPRGNLVHYYLDTGGRPRKEIPLGSDYTLAVQKWSELTSAPKPAAGEGTFASIEAGYWRDIIPTKAARTQQDNRKEFAWLMRFFNDPPAPLDKIEPMHIRQYLDWRVKAARALAEEANAERVRLKRAIVPIPADHGHTRANRDKALFSHMWNYARANGYTKASNPCAGIKGFRETGRDAYVSNEMLDRLMAHAGVPLQFALKLAHLTGQRPADVLRMNVAHVVDGILNVRQGKTKAKLRIVVEGELAALLDEIRAFKKGLGVFALSILTNEKGVKLTVTMLRKRFDKARLDAGIAKETFQFRDLRAKTATEVDEGLGTREAQALLGHTTESMTADYIRHKIGKKVRPLR